MRRRIAALLRRTADLIFDEFDARTEAEFDAGWQHGSNITITGACAAPTMLLNGVPTVWSEDFEAFVSCCPTRCDPDCELNDEGGCHEYHQVSWKRAHDPVECELRQIPMTTTGATSC